MAYMEFRLQFLTTVDTKYMFGFQQICQHTKLRKNIYQRFYQILYQGRVIPREHTNSVEVVLLFLENHGFP